MNTCQVCPWWLGYFLLNPLRLLWHKPEKILQDHLTNGMKVLDIGSGMGFFTLSMAELVGETGRVIAVDLQEKMLQALKKRASNKGLAERIEARKCSSTSLEILDFSGQIDFALAFAMVHEVPDRENLFKELFAALKQGGRLLISEPKGHVTKEQFAQTASEAKACGFTILEYPCIRGGLSMLLEKQSIEF